MSRLVVVVMALVVAGCGGVSPEAPPQSSPSPSQPTSAQALTTGVTPATTVASPTGEAPSDDASVEAVMNFVRGGIPVDTVLYEKATDRDGTVTQLSKGAVAFTSPFASCFVGDQPGYFGDLMCSTSIADPPPQPESAMGNWQARYVGFTGEGLIVGQGRGDPGIFVYGTGPELPVGHAITSVNLRCRVDATGLYCVNYASSSAIRIDDAGVHTYGCLQSVPPSTNAGWEWRC